MSLQFCRCDMMIAADGQRSSWKFDKETRPGMNVLGTSATKAKASEGGIQVRLPSAAPNHEIQIGREIGACTMDRGAGSSSEHGIDVVLP